MFEFFELPGAGKIELVQVSVDKLETQGYTCCDKDSVFIIIDKAVSF